MIYGLLIYTDVVVYIYILYLEPPTSTSISSSTMVRRPVPPKPLTVEQKSSGKLDQENGCVGSDDHGE